MKITYLGLSCFKIKCKNIDIIIDPYDNKNGLTLKKTKADVVLVTHNHSNHNNTQDLNSEIKKIQGPGEYEINDTFIRGKETFHDNSNGSERGINTIYKIEDEKISLAHLGDLGQKELSKEQLEFLDNVDILLIPIGGKYTINHKEAIKLINDIEPRVVMPMHYKIPNLKLDIADESEFVKEIGLSPEKMDEFKVSKNDLPSEDVMLVILNKQ